MSNIFKTNIINNFVPCYYGAVRMGSCYIYMVPGGGGGLNLSYIHFQSISKFKASIIFNYNEKTIMIIMWLSNRGTSYFCVLNMLYIRLF